MFTKILVANRGEIACRVFKTAKAMGIKTVAVYSDADKNALHVQMADEAVHIGAAPASQSYLIIDKIIEACKQTGAEAVHPGYGFLSERAEFAERLKAENIAFIGPPVNAIEAMGDKITSKKLAQEAGVSTVPGHMGLIDDADHAATIAAQIGYPVMIKASAGGGGKGMRIAWNDAEAREGFDRSKSEAASSFGDDRIFIEKFVVQPRHIEIQVLADTHGNCIYLGERECSIQRRNQKVIEEAPSPFLDEATRKAMGEQSVALAQAVGYASAGTVEFIVDKDRKFYFLEMNTRLQVEHPVTELITGVDLVEQMIRVANGEKLALAQEDVKLNGWAIESRLYAEDPYRNFLPSIGRLTRYRPPLSSSASPSGSASAHALASRLDASTGAAAGGDKPTDAIVRNDTGVFEGGEISMFYDPMIAKLCTWGKNREAAVTAMSHALDAFEVEGIGHNLPFCAAVMKHERFKSGNITTAFIEEEYPDGFEGVTPNDTELKALASIAAAMKLSDERRIGTPIKASGDNDYVAVIDGQHIKLAVQAADTHFEIALSEDGTKCQVHIDYTPGIPLVRAKVDATDYIIKTTPITGGYRLRVQGLDLNVKIYTPRIAELASLMLEKLPPDTSKLLLCPMPGLIVKLNVQEGDKIEEGQALAIVEAMKMENVLRAEKAGTVSKIPVAVGDSLAVDEVIMEFEG